MEPYTAITSPSRYHCVFLSSNDDIPFIYQQRSASYIYVSVSNDSEVGEGLIFCIGDISLPIRRGNTVFDCQRRKIREA